ncbi:MAG: glycosyltransferase [Candidatus Azobacteroides sp.]|nr:glycosyltransferase [Candidatus Azobacteroides sp.]
MKQKPVFSIITITYNAEKHIRRTIESIIRQSYSGIEYIIVDGKSTDHTIDIINSYRNFISCFVCEPDEGLYDAMNKGLLNATGDYIWFLNAGDSLYSTDTVEKLSHALPSSFPDILYGDTAIINEAGTFLYLRHLRPPEKLSWKSFRMGMTVCHQSFIVKREIAPLFDLTYKFSSDFDWCIRCMKETDSIFNTGQILSNYMKGGLTSSHHKESLKERYAIMQKYYGRITTFIMHIRFLFRYLKNK